MLRSLATLFSGNLLVQIISLAIMPIVTRVYGPVELGLYQHTITIALIVSPFVNLSLNQVIIKEADEVRRAHLYSAAIAISMLTALFFAITYAIFSVIYRVRDELWFLNAVAFYFILIAPSILVVLQAVCLGEHRYTLYTRSVVVQSLTSNLGKLLFGIISPTSISLLLSIVIGALLPLRLLGKNVNVNLNYIRLGAQSLVVEVKKNFNFTFYFTVSAFVSILVNWHIILVAPAFAEAEEVGYLSLALIITRTAIFPFISSVATYCYSELAKKMKKSERVVAFLCTIAFVGFFISTMVAVLFYLAGDVVLVNIFGNEWVGVNIFIMWLSLPMITSFTLYPLYYSVSNINGYQSKLILVDLAALIASIGVVVYCVSVGKSLIFFVVASSVVLALCDVMKFLVTVNLTRILNRGACF